MEKKGVPLAAYITLGIALAFILIFYNTVSNITGFALQNNISVSIKNMTKGEITSFDYDSTVYYGNMQTIFVEFSNTGTNPYMANIAVFVYYYENSKLNETAHYYDSSVYLYPGMKRAYKNSFLPVRLGTYYIKVRAEYGSRAVETWGAFNVQYYTTTTIDWNVTTIPWNGTTTTSDTTTTVEPSAPSFFPTLPPTYLYSTPRIDAEYPEMVEIARGDSYLVFIRAVNRGNINLSSVKLYVSTADIFAIDINPKVVNILETGESKLFLISIEVPVDTPSGDYPLDFEVTSDYARRRGSLTIAVKGINITDSELENRIINYKLLIYEIEGEISSAIHKGLDVSKAVDKLNNAKEELRLAEEYLKEGEHEKSFDALINTKRGIEGAVFELAHSMFFFYIAPPFDMFLFFLMLILFVFILFLYLFYRRRKKKETERPRMLKRVEAET